MRIIWSACGIVCGWLFGTWALVKFVLDQIGRADVMMNIPSDQGLVAVGLRWLFSTPWWVPSLIPVGILAVWAWAALWLTRAAPPPSTAPIIRDRLSSPKPLPPDPALGDARFIDFQKMTPLIDVTIDVSRLSNAVPWLVFNFTLFNGCPCPMHPVSARGRVAIGLEEFHGAIDIEAPSSPSGPGRFFECRIKVPVSGTERDFLLGSSKDTHLLVGFSAAQIECNAFPASGLTLVGLNIPSALVFDATSGRLRWPLYSDPSDRIDQATSLLSGLNPS
jgi:hypothetical protein